MAEPSLSKAIDGVLSAPRYKLGLDVGYGQTSSPSDSGGSQYQRTTSDVMRAYAQARNDMLGIEAGFMKLPEMHTSFSTGDYPSYKRAAQGILVSYPQTASVTQDITASAPYVRGILYLPKGFGAEPYVFGGKARVRTDNHEHAIYNDRDINDFREKLKLTADYYGLGVEVPLSKDLTMRAEYGRIPRATDDYHTNTRNIDMGTIGLGWTF